MLLYMEDWELEIIYKYEGTQNISIDIPFGEYRILLGATKEHEDVFNQIISSFKFLEQWMELQYIKTKAARLQKTGG